MVSPVVPARRALPAYLVAATLARGADAGAAVGVVLLVTLPAVGAARPALLGGLLATCLTAPHLLGPLLARWLDRAPDGRGRLAAGFATYAAAVAAAGLLLGRVPVGVARGVADRRVDLRTAVDRGSEQSARRTARPRRTGATARSGLGRGDVRGGWQRRTGRGGRPRRPGRAPLAAACGCGNLAAALLVTAFPLVGEPDVSPCGGRRSARWGSRSAPPYPAFRWRSSCSPWPGRRRRRCS
ncbi:hypothetical protein ACLQ29_10520 [Micromonospora sp. DT228]|uniref:hypothetical protein n=1 Tax=Micromonospora sp. DT228 TaxID=3393443 RepID=UPI003CF95890